ncbi:MAG TPA: DUF2235 domain-containing protein [Chthoniobacter sp.]|jgi:uncharacterized protein (DUF2235 family)
MKKRIIFCADGTWDTAQNDTNVYKIYKALTVASDQVAFYDDGVGSDGTPIEKLAGGAIGQGIFQKIKDGYTRIAHVYEKDDEIFIFGFSRGAFTARSLAGMIAVCGLPTAAFDDALVEAAFRAYQYKSQRAAFLAEHPLDNAQIKMVGVWDTVGSLGVPALFGGVDPLMDGFLDTSLHPDVHNAFHALAIDERRQEFPPTLYQLPQPPVAGQVLEQVWFSGVHCDVGGGYADTALSDITMSWMLGKAMGLGLEVDPTVAKHYTNMDPKFALGQIHESWSPLWLFPKWRSVPADAAVSNSVVIRYENVPVYRPHNIAFGKEGLAPARTEVPVVNPIPAQP